MVMDNGIQRFIQIYAICEKTVKSTQHCDIYVKTVISTQNCNIYLETTLSTQKICYLQDFCAICKNHKNFKLHV